MSSLIETSSPAASSKADVPTLSGEVQAIYDKLCGPSAEYCHFMQYGGAYTPHVATHEDVDAAMDWLRDAIIERKAEIDAGVKSGRNVQIIDQMRAEFRAMSERYDEAADALDAIACAEDAATLKAAE